MNIVDQAISYFAPKRALTRVQNRKAAEVMQSRSFTGAGRGRRLKNWNPRNGDGNTPNVSLLSTLRERSRDLENNNEYVKAGFNLITDNTVGEGIVADFKGGSLRTRDKLEKIWQENVVSTDFDVTGRDGLYGISHLAAHSLVRDGEVFLVREWRADAPLGFRIKILESDFLGTDRYNPLIDSSGMRNTYFGIDHDEHGRPQFYNFFKNHTGDTTTIGNPLETVRVPASDVIHLFRRDRAQQVRGFPWISPAMVRAKNLDEYEDVQLERQKIAACFSVFVHDIDTQNMGNNVFGQESEYEDLERLEAGIIEKLPAGKTISFANPPTVQNYDEYTTTQLRAIARSLDITYESLVADYSKTNFASGRMGRLLENKRFKVLQNNLFIPKMMMPISKWFFEGVALTTNIRTDDVFTEWLTPIREMIDPLKEIQAEKMEIRAGLLSFNDALRKRNKDPEKHYSDLESVNEKLDDHGLELDIDARKKTQSGLTQPSKEESGENETEA